MMKKRMFFVSLLLLVLLAACSPKVQPEVIYIYVVQTPTAILQEDGSLTNQAQPDEPYFQIQFPTQTPLPPGVLPTATPDMTNYWDNTGLLAPEYVKTLNSYFPDSLGKCHRSYTDTQVKVWYDGGFTLEAAIVGSFVDNRAGGFVGSLQPADITGEGIFTINMDDRNFSIGCDEHGYSTIFSYFYVPIGKVVELKITSPDTQSVGYYSRTNARFWSLLTPEEVNQITFP